MLDSLVNIIKSNNTITIVSKDKGGSVWATKVYYGYADDGHLYVILEKKGHAYTNILENKEIFFVIEKNDPIKFAQGIGEVEILGDTDKVNERRYVTSKNFPIIPFLRTTETVVVRIKIKRAFVSDFSEGWKPRIEVDLGNPKTFEEFINRMRKEPKFKVFIQATRPWALPATFSAVLFGTLISPTVDLIKFALVSLGAILVHLGINAFSDYMDYKKGADKWYTLGSSRVLVDELIKPRELFLLSSVLLIGALIVAFVVLYLTNFNKVMVYLIIIGTVAGLFYAFVPIGWKYIALGDVAVFIAWTGIAFGSYFIHTLNPNWNVILAFLPIALLIVAILQGNNMRDIKDDISSGYMTFASILGNTGSKIYYTTLVSLSYLLVIPLITFGILPFWSLIVFVSLPSAIKNIKWAFLDNYIQHGMLDLYTARLLQNYSALMVIALLIPKIVYNN